MRQGVSGIVGRGGWNDCDLKCQCDDVTIGRSSCGGDNDVRHVFFFEHITHSPSPMN